MDFEAPHLVHAVCETRTNSFIQIHNNWIACYYAFHLTAHQWSPLCSSPCQYLSSSVPMLPAPPSGLLIGLQLWYSAFSIRYIPCSRCARQSNHWELIRVSEEVSADTCVPGAVLMCVPRHYTCYQQWDEIINVQRYIWLIEDINEKCMVKTGLLWARGSVAHM